MGLVAMKNYLQSHGATSLRELCSHFEVDPEVLRSMLGHWISKGNVRQGQRTPRCGTKCGRCDVTMTEMYEWV